MAVPGHVTPQSGAQTTDLVWPRIRRHLAAILADLEELPIRPTECAALPDGGEIAAALYYLRGTMLHAIDQGDYWHEDYAARRAAGKPT